jgi:hypothetical protein
MWYIILIPKNKGGIKMRRMLTVSVPEEIHNKKLKAMYNMKVAGTTLSNEVAKIIEEYAEKEVE